MNWDCGEGAGEIGWKERIGGGMDGRKEEKEKLHGENNSCQSTPPLPPHSRHTSSKYDFVKVRVWLGDNADHYYVLSRFLVSRMLTVTKIPNHVAIKISLELKKLLIDNSLLDVSQTDLEANLFKLMERRGYGEEYINRYKMMTRFHHQRIPLVILVCGTACVGKSTVATQLAQRLNLPNVLQTDMVYELIRTSTDAPLASTPVWERDFPSSEKFVTEFAKECRIVRKGLDGDLRKAMKDGKPIIIEGIHLDPRIYLMDDESSGLMNQSNTCAATASSEDRIPTLSIKDEQFADQQTNEQEDLKDPKHSISDPLVVSYSSDAGASNEVDSARVVCEEQTVRDPIRNMCRETCGCSEQEMCSGSDKVKALTNSADSGDTPSSKHPQMSPTKAIVVPIVLKMDEFDQKTLLEEWIACKLTPGVLANEEEKEALISKLVRIQDYLCSFKSQGATVVNISATAFPQALDGLHSYLLQRIEEGCQILGTRQPIEAPDPNLSS